MSPTLIKILVIAGIVAALYAGYRYEMSQAYTAGFTAAQSDAAKVFNEQLSIKEKKNKEALLDIQAISDKWKDKAQKQPDTIEKIIYVNKIIEKEVFVCNDLGTNFIRVLMQSRNHIFAGNDGE